VLNQTLYPFNNDKWHGIGKHFTGRWNHMGTVNSEKVSDFCTSINESINTYQKQYLFVGRSNVGKSSLINALAN
jgi:ribosome biogenesis GTPase A